MASVALFVMWLSFTLPTREPWRKVSRSHIGRAHVWESCFIDTNGTAWCADDSMLMKEVDMDDSY